MAGETSVNDDDSSLSDDTGLSDQYVRASPWPVFVAVGLALSEIGVFVGIFPVAVFGLLLFGGSVAGILTESGYTSRPWPTLLVLGGILAVAGVAIIVWQTSLGAIDISEFGTNGVLSRALAITVAGIALVLAGGVASLFERTSV